MRRIFFKLTVLLLYFAAGIKASAEIGDGFNYGDFVYRVTADGECELVRPRFENGTVTIPAKVVYNEDTLTVTSLPEFAFYRPPSGYYYGELILPPTIRHIGYCAFANCHFTGELILPDSLVTIGDRAFESCSGFTGHLKIPDSVTSIGSGAFDDCFGFTGLTLGKSLTQIDGHAFDGCSGLTGELIFPETVKSIGGAAFRSCSGLTGELIFPETVKSIGGSAFQYCSGLTGHLNLPDISVIKEFTFYGCKGLTGITFPQSLQTIERGAFTDCTGLSGPLIFPESLTTIGDSNYSYRWVGAFEGCTGLSGELILPKNLNIIGNGTFNNCTGLTGELILPKSLTVIGNGVFLNCSGLKGYIILPPNIESIGNESFAGCVRLTGPVTIPASVRSIGSHSFKDTQITEVVFEPNSQIETIDGSFSGCADMANFSIPGATGSFSILNDAFNGCSSLTSLSLVGYLDKIQDKAESGCFDGCTSLRNIRFEDGENDLALVTARESLFGDCPLDSVYLGRNLTSDSNPFKGNRNIKYLAFGDPVKTIPQEGFAGCSGLTDLTIPGGMTEIGDDAFAGCDNVKKLTLMDNEEREYLFIGNNDGKRGIFSDMPLDSLYLGRQFASLNFKETNVFSGMTTLKSVTIGNGVTGISDNSFNGCTSISELHLPESIINIGKSAFAGCTALTDTLVIPAEVYQIMNEAFADCSSVIAIRFENNSDKELWCGKDAFRNIPAEKLVIGRNILPHPSSNNAETPFAGNAALREVELGVASNSIKDGYFAGCPSIKYINNYCTTPQYLHDTGFDTEVYKNAILKVPNSVLNTYKRTNGWRNFYNIYGLKDIMPEEVVITPDTLTVEVGDTYALTYTILPEDAKNKTVTWSSSDETVATVDENGLVTALLPGTATITATTINEVTAVCEVTVVIRPTEIVIEQEAELTQGESLQLTAVFTPEETTERELTWSSSDETIATVDENGLVSAIKVGKAVITATTSNGLTATCTVTVLRRIIYAESISLDSSEAELTQGESVRLTATVSPDNTDDKTVIWSSSDEAVATVDATGLVSAIREGKATVTATTSNGLTAACTVTVIPPVIEADGITLNITQTQIYNDETLQLMATVSPDDTTDKTVTWSSSNGEIATVDENGLVSPISEGKTTITATTANGLTASCEVTVLKRIVIISPESIALNITQAGLTEGERVQLTATVSPEDADDKTVTWTSDNSAVATVDASGLVSAISEGMATITATTANGLTASCEVNVLKRIVIISPESIALNITQAELTEGESLQLTANVSPENTTDKTVTWTSDNSTVATVDASGLVTAISEGEATVTASTVNGLAASCHIIVNGHEWREGNGSYIRVENGEIVVYGQGTAEVFNRQGRLVAKSKAGRITGLPRDIYFVRFANRSYKIRL